MRDLRVILVEDEILIRMLLKEQFRRNRCEIVGETGDGNEVFELVEKTLPDFICMDIKLRNGMDGILAAKKLNEKNLDIPILFISAYNYYDQVFDVELPNKIGYIEKPIQEIQLIEIINNFRRNLVTS